MKRVLSSKQVGDVQYMCESLAAVCTILDSGEIRMSRKKEKSINTGKLEYFTSLTRNFKSLVAQNSIRWRDGIILDGTKLSDSYSIDALHFSGYNMENQKLPNGGKFKIKQITKWPEYCLIKFVGWSKELLISLRTYLEIRDICMTSLSESAKEKCRMCILEGKRKVNGVKFEERILFNTPGGAPSNIFQYMSKSTIAEISDVTNQYEERIHGPKSKSEASAKRFTSENVESSEYPVVHIHNCVKGVVIRAEDAEEWPELVEEILEILRTQYNLSDPETIIYN